MMIPWNLTLLQLLVFHSHGHRRTQLPVTLGDHHLQLGRRQVIHGRKAILGRVVNGPIEVSLRASQKDQKDQEDQDPTGGPRMTNVRTEDGKSINSNQNIGPA